MHRKLKLILPFILMTFEFSVLAQKAYRIRSLDFSGQVILRSEQLYEQFNTLPRNKLDKLFFWKKNPLFSLGVFMNDIDRLRTYYVRNGFLNAEISYLLDSVKTRNLIDIHVLIKENGFVTIDSIRFQGSLDSLSHAMVDSVQRIIPLRSTLRFRDEDIFKTENILLQHFNDAGYPLVKTNYQIAIDQQKNLANVIFNIDPGKQSFFGDIHITGDSLISEAFIRKRISLTKSDLYSQQKMNITQQQIFDTDLFQYVIINALKDSVEHQYIPVDIFVKELPRYTFEGGVGYGTEDRLRLSGQMTRLSFLGGARRLILEAKTSYFFPLSVDLHFIQPDLFMPNLDFSFNPFFVREREQSYQIDRLGAGVNFLYQLNKKTIANLSYAVEQDDLTELDDLQLDEDELKHDKSILSLGGVYNSTNHAFYPSKGYQVDASVSYAGLGFSDDIQYYQFQLSVRNYFLLSEDLIMAMRFKTGIIQHTQDATQTPIEERFYAGGASSLRGWIRHGISPVNDEGSAIGGNTLMEASTEFRFPIYDIFGGVVFMDMGNVWADSYQYSIDALHYSAGIGFRIKSPIGPVRLDMATPVFKDAFDFQFFISIGQTF